eukprot:14640865-Ditylum_brightwellii.AAC.2
MDGFKDATSLDVNMEYYHIELTYDASKLCTIVLPWGKSEYCKLPMGLCNSPGIFQEKMNEGFTGIEEVMAYIDDLLLITKGTYEEHSETLDQVLKKLEKAGLKVNMNKSFFAQK